jgi:hypothetical protein
MPRVGASVLRNMGPMLHAGPAAHNRDSALNFSPLAYPTGAGRHWRTSGSGVSSGSTCARNFS